MSSKLRIGIVGMGPHFREDLFQSLVRLTLRENVEVTALCDSAQEAREWLSKYSYFERAYATASMSDPEFWKRIDVVICCSWPQVHEYVLARAIQEGKHCLCEKPAASTSKALVTIIGKGLPQDLVIKVGHVFRYRPGGQVFIEETQGKAITCLNLEYAGSKPCGGRWGLSSRHAFSLTHLTHALDFIAASAGEIRRVVKVTWTPWKGKESVTVTLKTVHCPAVTLFATNAAPAFCLNALAICDDGSAVRMNALHSVAISGLSGFKKRSGPYYEPHMGDPENDFFTQELLGFVGEIKGTGKSLLPGLVEAQKTLAVIEEIEGRG